MTASDPSGLASFLPLTTIYPEDMSQLMIKMTDVYSTNANAVNIREIAIYDLQQVLTGQRFFDPLNVQNQRFTFRTVYQFGAIAAGATLNIPHNIAGTIAPFTTMFTRMYGTCITAVVDYRPLPYTDAILVTNQVSLSVVGANIVIVNGATAPNITSGLVILEYLLS